MNHKSAIVCELEKAVKGQQRKETHVTVYAGGHSFRGLLNKITDSYISLQIMGLDGSGHNGIAIIARENIVAIQLQESNMR